MICPKCDGDGKAHGADRPFEWSPECGYPGPCPVCNGSGVAYCCEGERERPGDEQPELGGRGPR